MQAVDVWKAAVGDTVDFLDELIALLQEHEIRYCVIGGQAVNAFADPLISLDLDLIVAAEQQSALETVLGERFQVSRHAHSVNISAPGSDLRVQFRTDPRYLEFVDRAAPRLVLGVQLPVARAEDVLQGKVWAAMDATRRPSKRRKDLLDIERLVDAHPSPRKLVPPEILEKISDV